MANRSIILQAEDYLYDEATAASAITPGMLLAFDTNGKLKAHASAGQNADRMFALEDETQGNGIDDDYSANDLVRYGVFRTGHRILAILKDGESVKRGDPLESAGDGTLKKHTAGSAGVVEYPEAIVAYADEDKDLSGSSGAESYDSGGTGWNKRIKVRIA